MQTKLTLMVCLLFIGLVPPAGGAPPQEGDTLPQMVLEMPADLTHRAYLGLSGDRPFSPADIRTEVLVIEIFSMYCPHCQREAPTLNEFYGHIESDARLRGRVKLIGIGVGNSKFEVDFFRQTYNVPFPLFADEDFAVHKKLGQVMTPYFIGVRSHADGSLRIFYAQLGGSKNARDFLKALLEHAGL